MLRPPCLIYEGTSLHLNAKLQEGEFTSVDNFLEHINNCSLRQPRNDSAN